MKDLQTILLEKAYDIQSGWADIHLDGDFKTRPELKVGDRLFNITDDQRKNLTKRNVDCHSVFEIIEDLGEEMRSEKYGYKLYKCKRIDKSDNNEYIAHMGFLAKDGIPNLPWCRDFYIEHFPCKNHVSTFTDGEAALQYVEQAYRGWVKNATEESEKYEAQSKLVDELTAKSKEKLQDLEKEVKKYK